MINTYDDLAPNALRGKILGCNDDDTASALNACYILAGLVRDLQAQVKQLNKALATVVHMPEAQS